MSCSQAVNWGCSQVKTQVDLGHSSTSKKVRALGVGGRLWFLIGGWLQCTSTYYRSAGVAAGLSQHELSHGGSKEEATGSLSSCLRGQMVSVPSAIFSFLQINH